MSKTTRPSGVLKKRKRKTTENLDSKPDFSLLFVFGEIDAYCEKTDLKIDVSNKTRLIYNEIHRATFTNGKPHDALVVSCILIAAETLDVSKQQLRKVVLLYNGNPLCVHGLKDIIEYIHPHIKEAGTVTETA